MKKRNSIITLRIIAVIFLVLQLISYLGSIIRKEHHVHENIASSAGYYIGYNFFLLIAVALFLRAWSLKKRLRREEVARQIDAIGNGDEA